MDQQKVGGNELARAEEIMNPVSILLPELCQKSDGVAREIALPIIFVEQDRNRAGSGIHLPTIL